MNQNTEETFYLETEEGSKECKIITSMYSETRKKYYLIYEYVESDTEEIYVSSYEPDKEDGILKDIEDEQELQEITKFLEEFEGENE